MVLAIMCRPVLYDVSIKLYILVVNCTLSDHHMVASIVLRVLILKDNIFYCCVLDLLWYQTREQVEVFCLPYKE